MLILKSKTICFAISKVNFTFSMWLCEKRIHLIRKVSHSMGLRASLLSSAGGIIEACPPSDSVTALTVDMVIEPNGNIRMVSNGDQIHAETPLGFWGLSMPQSSVEPEMLNEVCNKVAQACVARAIMGYFTLDFVTFIHPRSVSVLVVEVEYELDYFEIDL